MLNKSNVGEIIAVPPHFKKLVIERVLEASLENSKSSGKPQIKLQCEIVSPAEDVVGDTKYIIGGQKITHYLGLSTEITGQARQSPWAGTYVFFEKCGLPTEWDDTAPDFNSKIESALKGLEFENILSSQEKIARTKQADGKSGDVIKDSRGQPIKQGFEWNTFLQDVVGRSTTKTNVPY
jgi:hypothetical protein